MTPDNHPPTFYHLIGWYAYVTAWVLFAFVAAVGLWRYARG